MKALADIKYSIRRLQMSAVKFLKRRRIRATIYSSKRKRYELNQRYTELTDGSQYDYPMDYDGKVINDFINGELEKHGQTDKLQAEEEDRSIDFREYFTEYVEELLYDVILSYRRQGVEHKDIFVGAINSGAFDASLMELFGSDPMILVNAGMMSSSYQCGKIILNGSIKERGNDDPFYDLRQCSDYLLQVITHAADGDSRTAKPTDINSLTITALAGALSESSTRFIIAHEIAHLSQNTNSGKSVAWFEIDADTKAMECVVDIYKNNLRNIVTNNERLTNEIELIAPIIDMEIWYLKKFVQNINDGKTLINYNRYPDDLVRRENLIKVLFNHGLWTKVEPLYYKLDLVIDATYLLFISLKKHSGVFKELNEISIQDSTLEDIATEKTAYETTRYKNDKYDVLRDLVGHFQEQIGDSKIARNLKININPYAGDD